MSRCAPVSRRRTGAVIAAVTLIAVLASCTSGSGTSLGAPETGGATPSAASGSEVGPAVGSAPASEEASETPKTATGLSGVCAKNRLTLKKPGKLVVATDKPAYTPWFVDNKPSNGKGFESAVAYAIATKLGFRKTDVVWTTAKFGTLFSPRPTTFDFDLNQVSISDKRKQVVDFSSGYYDVTQAVVTTKGSKIAAAKTIADLKGAKLGAQRATTSYQALLDVIQPASKPAVYPSNDNAKLALAAGQVDGLVVDLPTALYIASAELDDGLVIGQLENAGGKAEQFGAVLEKTSNLTPCLTEAIDALRADGTLAALEKKWLAGTGGAPVLT